MKRIFISQPMNGASETEIKSERIKAIEKAKALVNEDIYVIDSIIKNNPPSGCNQGLWYLSESLELLSTADLAYFARGWENARGCKIEHECASNYGIPILEDVKQ